MILLDEIDEKEKNEKEKAGKRETLPPYSPSPRRSLRLPVIATPPNTGSERSFTTTLHVPLSHHSRSAPLPSISLGQSQSSLTLNSNVSSQTLVPAPPTPSPSPSQFSLPLASLSTPFPVYRTFPPAHVRASNNVYIQRDSATISGSFLIDPALQVPDCLLPDDPDVLVSRSSRMKGSISGKRKQKRANLCLITRSGDVCVDIWVREGSSRQRSESNRRQGSASSSRRQGSSDSDSVNSQSSSGYWEPTWTSPPPSLPWPDKIKARTDIDIQSEAGSITVRIHAQSHQRLRIRVTSAQGSIAVGIPRTFAGIVQANADISRSDSADSMSSLSRFSPASATYLPGTLSSWGGIEKDREKQGTSSDNSPGSMFGEIAQTLPLKPMPVPITARQPVHFSGELEEVVTALSEHRKTARGRYLVGDSSNSLISEHMGAKRYFDELHLESCTGTMGVFFNDESPQPKGDRLITKLLNKAW